MTYEEALAYWYGHVNFEQSAPLPDELKLERMRALLRLLSEPQRRLRIVHVAGSKGKGSVSATLAAVLQRAGYRTALFTSPHLCRVEERFQVDGQPINRDELAAVLTDVRAAAERGLKALGGPPTFFEIATAVGLLHFVRRRAGAAVLEVGLGGRLDSTNVCQPVLSVITSISYDHTAVLGDRLASIAREKAGIVKPGRPVLSGATVPEARAVIEAVCRARHAPLRQLDADFSYRYEAGAVTDTDLVRPRVAVTTRGREWPWLELSLLGEHQAANAAVAVACVEQLRELGWHLPDSAVEAGLRNVDWPARLEVCGRRPTLLLDCAHNVASAAALADTLRTSFPPQRRLLVFAASADKDVAGMFRVLAPHFAHAFLTRYSANLRGVAPERLAELWRAESAMPVTLCATPEQALAEARALAAPEDLVCVTGSVFLAGELRPLLGCANYPGAPGR
jgi:dihydrofolate synthase/folylpolyglutamate synthase